MINSHIYEDLPSGRDNNWGGRFLPIHGIESGDWWPTLDEVELIDSYIFSDKYIDVALSALSKDRAIKLNNRMGVTSIFNWFVDNFTKEKYTDNYSKPITLEMIDKGIKEYFSTKALRDLKQIDYADKFIEIEESKN